MERINIALKLYATTTIVIHDIDKKVGSMIEEGISTFHRGTTKVSKLSTVARIFDAVKGLGHEGEGSFAVYENDEGEYVEMEKDFCFISKEDSSFILKKSESFPQYLIPTALAAWELSHGENEELKEAYKTACAGNETEVFRFCDSFYYGSVCPKAGLCTVQSDNIEEAEARAAFRSDSYKPTPWAYKNMLDGMKYSMFDTSSHKAKSAKKEDSLEEFFKKAQNGEFIIPVEWPEEVKGFIIPLDRLKTYSPVPEFMEVVKKISYRMNRILGRMASGCDAVEAIGSDAVNVMLTGKPGTGKTTLLEMAAAATGMPCVTSPISKDTDEDVANGTTRIVDSKAKFVETDSLLIQKYGGIEIFEEINLMAPSVAGVLMQKIEYPFIVKENGYKDVVRNPLDIVFGTMNCGTNGSKSPNQALANRFKSTYVLDDPERGQFIEILKKATGHGENICGWVYDAYDAVVQYLKTPEVNAEDICMGLSVRTCIGAIQNMEEGEDPLRALKNSVSGAIALTDLELSRDVSREVIDALPDAPDMD